VEKKMVGEKINQKELAKAQLQMQKNMLNPANMQMGLMNLLNQGNNPMAGMLNTQLNVPLAQNPYTQQMAMPGMMPNPNMALNAQQQQAMMQTIAVPNNGGKSSGVLMQTNVRLGKTKTRIYGQCKNCKSMKAENFIDVNGNPAVQYLCITKNEIVDPEDGILYSSISKDEKGKEIKLVDGMESCRQFKVKKQKLKI
jgi:hypothetical protein